MSKPWGAIGAWADEAERADEEQASEAMATTKVAEDKSFPSLKEAASATGKSKKQKKKMSLSEFTMGAYAAPTASSSTGLTRDQMAQLPTGPRQRSEDEMQSGRIGGGFPSYGRSGGAPGQMTRNRDDSDGSWAGGRRNYGGFDDGSQSRVSDFAQPSRADEVDDWGKAKKTLPSLDQSRQGRYGGLGAGGGGGSFGAGGRGGYGGGVGAGSFSKADEVDNWGAGKSQSFVRSSTFGAGYRDSSSGGVSAGGGVQEERRRLVLEPRKVDAGLSETSPSVVKTSKPNPFGAARPREQVLAEKGLDYKKLDSEIEAKKGNSQSRPSSAQSSRPSSAQSNISESSGLNNVENVVKPRPKVNPFGDAKPREVLLEEQGKDWRKMDSELEHRRIDRGRTLKPRCPSSVNGITFDPQPDWNAQSLLAEIKSLEKTAISKSPQLFIKTPKRMERSDKRGFVMRVSEEDISSDESEDEESKEEENQIQPYTVVKNGTCDDLYLSDESEFDCEHECLLMDKMTLAENALYEVTKDHKIKVEEEVRNQVSVFQMEIMKEREKFRSAIARVEEYGETRKELDQKLDLHYQQKVSEAVEAHLAIVRREFELKWQREASKIRSEEAQEEARRREIAIQEEKMRQELARAEDEMRAKIKAEEAKKEAERAAKEVAEKELVHRQAAEQKVAEEKALKEKAARTTSGASTSVTSNVHAGGLMGKSIQAAESALTMENQRLKKLEELEAINQSLRSRSNEDFSSFEKHIARAIKQIRGTKDNVSAKINEIVNIFKNSRCPVSISVATFAKKMVSAWQNPFACSYVIVYVTSQFPEAMDILLAEFHTACIYTVPKHIVGSKSALDSDAYQRIDSIMRLYGALVQTDVRDGNVTNHHGIEQGWVWLARFLNKISANNRATATALNAFLQTAGYGLHQKYKSQFLKVLIVVKDHFLAKLKTKQDSSDLQLLITDIATYIEDRMYLREPEGRVLQTNLLSSEFTAELDQQNNYHHQNNNYQYQRSYNRNNYY